MAKNTSASRYDNEGTELLEGVVNFQKLCKEYGIKAVLRTIKDLDYNFYTDLLGLGTTYDAKELPAILKR